MYSYGIIEFTSRTKVQGKFKFKPLNQTTYQYVANKSNKSNQHVDMWAKVDDDYNIMEILGQVGDHAIESKVQRLHYGIEPCKYPVILNNDQVENSAIHAITVDNVDTVDRDDAFSIDYEKRTIGIHITNVAQALLGNSPEVFEWISKRGASAYWQDENGALKTSPMLPHLLISDVLSLNHKCTRPCISVFLEFDEDFENIINTYHKFTHVYIDRNETYTSFVGTKEYDDLVCMTKLHDSHDQIAWLAIKYNCYFAKANAANAANNNIILREQESSNTSAVYAFATQAKTHIAMGGVLYGHFTSPIRRYADLHNQMVIMESQTFNVDINALNTRMLDLQQFGYRDTVMALSYKYMHSPGIVKAKVETSEDGLSLLIFVPGSKRIRIPLKDNYFANPIVEHVSTLKNKVFEVELFGVLVQGRAMLRCNVQHNADHLALSKPRSSHKDVTIFENITTNSEFVIPYKLDTFQLDCEKVIQDGDDLLAMAPTGSGKTVIALLGVQYTFSQNKRAILTSPIKALSNQKYAEFSKWFPGRVSLLTGDIQSRATPPGGDGNCELIIMTSEIYCNKLAKINDPDLSNVGLVIMDEVHYINDAERGSVWERGIYTAGLT